MAFRIRTGYEGDLSLFKTKQSVISYGALLLAPTLGFAAETAKGLAARVDQTVSASLARPRRFPIYDEL